jgi:VIT1/CCC1 family predicted Fe2+/Mn2+ transporter
VPLSEEEQRLLDEMERNLYGSSQDVHSAGSTDSRISSRGILVGFLGGLLGLTLLVLGVTLQTILLGVAGFVVMFAGIVGAVSLKAPAAKSSQSKVFGSPAPRAKKPGFMSRLEDRWDQREQ